MGAVVAVPAGVFGGEHERPVRPGQRVAVGDDVVGQPELLGERQPVVPVQHPRGGDEGDPVPLPGDVAADLGVHHLVGLAAVGRRPGRLPGGVHLGRRARGTPGRRHPVVGGEPRATQGGAEPQPAALVSPR